MKNVLFVGILAAAITLQAAAGVDEWTRLGLAPGGSAASVVVASSRPQTLYSRSSSAVLRSTDAGATWTTIYDRDNTSSIAVSATDPNTVYLVAGEEGHFEVSRDGGQTWQEPNPTWSAFAAKLVTSPAEPNAVYAHFLIGLNKTTNYGQSWEDLSSAPGLPSTLAIRDFEADPVRAGRLYLLHSGFNGAAPQAFTSSDGGASWNEFPLPPGQVVELAIDPTRPGSLLVVNSTSSVWQTSNFGRTWRRPSLTALPSGLDRVWVGSGPAPLVVVGSASRLFVSRDGGRFYEDMSYRLTNRVLALAFHPQRSTTFFAGLAGGGVARSDDAGRNFVYSRLAIAGITPITASPIQPGELYTTSGQVLFRSHDGGRSWKSVFGLDESFGGPLTGAVAVGYGSERKVLVGLNQGIAVSFGEFAWSLTCPGCGRIELFRTTPADPSLIFALHGVNAESSLRSSDGGASWEIVDFAPLALGTTNSQEIYRKARTSQGERLEKSINGGATWSDISNGLHEPLFVFDVAAHPLDGNLLCLATNEGLYRSTTGGAGWTRVWFEAEANDVIFLALDPSDPETLLLLVREDGAPPDSDGSRYFSSRDGGATWSLLGGPQLPNQTGRLISDPHHPGTFLAVNSLAQPWAITLSTPSSCVPSATTHCLNGGRFQVKASWRDFQGTSGVGQTRPLTDDTGAFWFFRPENLEVAVKALDGSGVNGHFWLFYGALSNVEYSLDVVDTHTGEPRTYWNPPRNLASRGDTLAVEASSALAATAAPESPRRVPSLRAPRGTCTAGVSALCLQGGRFQVEVEWTDFQGGSGLGQAEALTSDTGSFWFFNNQNLELLVKVLDGRAANGHFWVFYGALTNVGYRVTVTDTETGEVRSYENTPGRFGSRADTTAF